MKKIFLIVMLFTPLTFWGQEFSFSMYFEDAIGNKDTLILGYDPAATDGINLQFGEENIIFEPFIKDLDVRAGKSIEYISYFWPLDIFLSKKHITPKTCNMTDAPIPEHVYIYCKHFPLRVSWDPVFDDDCNRYSFIKEWDGSGWIWVTCGMEDTRETFFMRDSDSATFENIGATTLYNCFNLYVLTYNFWNSPNINSIKKIAPEKPLIYPNPAKDILYVQTGVGEFESAQIRDLTGRIVLTSSHNPVQISALRKGAYLLEVKIKGSPDSFVQKFYK